MSYDQPNYTQIPNRLLDEHMPDMGLAELKVVLVVCRQTFGWQKRKDRLSLSQIAEKAGLSRRGTVDGIQDAMERGVLDREKSGNSYKYFVCVSAPSSDAESPEVVKQSHQNSEAASPEVVKQSHQGSEAGSPQMVKELHTQKKGKKKESSSSGRRARALESVSVPNRSPEETHPPTPTGDPSRWSFLDEHHEHLIPEISALADEIHEERTSWIAMARRLITSDTDYLATSTAMSHVRTYDADKVVAAWLIAAVNANSNPLAYANTILERDFQPPASSKRRRSGQRTAKQPRNDPKQSPQDAFERFGAVLADID
mgnify:CR=1 FL=1